MKLILSWALLGVFACCGNGKETPPPGTAPKPFKLAVTDDFTLPNGLVALWPSQSTDSEVTSGGSAG